MKICYLCKKCPADEKLYYMGKDRDVCMMCADEYEDYRKHHKRQFYLP